MVVREKFESRYKGVKTERSQRTDYSRERERSEQDSRIWPGRPPTSPHTVSKGSRMQISAGTRYFHHTEKNKTRGGRGGWGGDTLYFLRFCFYCFIVQLAKINKTVPYLLSLYSMYMCFTCPHVCCLKCMKLFYTILQK